MDEIRYDMTWLKNSSCNHPTIFIDSNHSIAELFAWDAAGVPAALTGMHNIMGQDLIKFELNCIKFII
jgi:hypothetical protein